MNNCSLIISTYNWPEALELCLESVKNQHVKPFEVIIADDGSTHQTKLLIEKYQSEGLLNLVHIWQPDNGFQLAQIRNKAIAASTGEYIIQIDGDVILHRHFVEDHLNAAKADCFIQGSRVMLGKKVSAKLLGQKSIEINLFGPDIKRKENGIRLLWLSNLLQKKYRNRYPIYWARGANMSFWKKDLLLVNGYNENFTGWGDEDSELTLRLLNSGKTKLYLKFAGIIYHLYHNEDASKAKSSKNRSLLELAFSNKIVSTDNGLDKYLQK